MANAIYLSDALERELRELAERTGKPQETILEEALHYYLARRNFASLGAGDDPTLDARQTRELLKDAWGKP
jgi:predicted transcriptional regulator